MSESKHTPGDLHAVKTSQGYVDIFDGFDRDICTLYGPRAEADAARIALAWNCHDELLEAARPVAGCVFGFSGDDAEYISVTAGELRALTAAIAKAEGRS